MLSLVSIGCVAVEGKHILVVNAIKQATMSRVGHKVHFFLHWRIFHVLLFLFLLLLRVFSSLI